MSRDTYNNIPKKRKIYVDADGNLEALSVNGDLEDMQGTATLVITSGQHAVATVSGTQITTNSFAVVSPRMAGPTSVGWRCFDGYMTISGTGAGVVSYIVKI